MGHTGGPARCPLTALGEEVRISAGFANPQGVETMRRIDGFRALVCAVALLGCAVSANAQDVPRAEFSAGWRLLNVPDAFGGNSQTLPLGWYADVAGNLNPTI